jgi:hypothetical protein
VCVAFNAMSNEMNNETANSSRRTSKSSVLSPDEPLPFYTDEQMVELKVMQKNIERRKKRPSIANIGAALERSLLPRCLRRQD